MSFFFYQGLFFCVWDCIFYTNIYILTVEVDVPVGTSVKFACSEHIHLLELILCSLNAHKSTSGKWRPQRPPARATWILNAGHTVP